MCNFWKCVPGAASARAEAGLSLHFKPVPMSLNFNYHQLGFFIDLKRTTTTDMQNVGIPLESMFGGRGVAYIHLIPVLTYNFDENALLGKVSGK